MFHFHFFFSIIIYSSRATPPPPSLFPPEPSRFGSLLSLHDLITHLLPLPYASHVALKHLGPCNSTTPRGMPRAPLRASLVKPWAGCVSSVAQFPRVACKLRSPGNYLASSGIHSSSSPSSSPSSCISGPISIPSPSELCSSGARLFSCKTSSSCFWRTSCRAAISTNGFALVLLLP